MMRARARFRQILATGECTPVAPIFDPLSARIADMLGWKVCKLSGSVGKFANLAVPDGLDLSTISDLVDVCRRIVRVSDACLVVDADDGGGTALNVIRSVRELEQAGVCAIEIEDNLVPSRLDAGSATVSSRHAAMVSTSEHVGKLEAAVAARRDPETMIVARTSAFDELAFAEALERVRAYAATGVEAIMLPNVPGGRRTIEAIRTVIQLPLFALRLPDDVIADAAFLGANKVLLRYFRQAPYAMAVQAIHDALLGLNADTADTLKPREAAPELLRQVDRTGEFREWQERFPSR